MAGQTGFFRGAGGAILELPLPLTENFQNQLTRGELVRVTKNGDPWIVHATAAAEPEPDGPVRPPVNAPKNDWIGYARAVAPELSVDDADAMTKADLIDKYGK